MPGDSFTLVYSFALTTPELTAASLGLKIADEGKGGGTLKMINVED